MPPHPHLARFTQKQALRHAYPTVAELIASRELAEALIRVSFKWDYEQLLSFVVR